MDNPKLESLKESARAYDSLFVPALFGQWADVTANASGVSPGQHVLDVACGTGVLTREMFQRVKKTGSVVGLDPNLGMLAVAAEHEENIHWEQGMAESLPYESAVFDSVVCQFGLMFFEDPALAIEEFLRVLKPTGTVTLAVWNLIESIPGYNTEHTLISKMAGPLAAAAVAAPFKMGNKNDLQDLLVQAGAGNVNIETHQGVARFPDIATMINAELRGWLPVMGINLKESVIQQILTEAEKEMSQFTGYENMLEFEIPAHIAVVTH